MLWNAMFFTLIYLNNFKIIGINIASTCGTFVFTLLLYFYSKIFVSVLMTLALILLVFVRVKTIRLIKQAPEIIVAVASSRTEPVLESMEMRGTSSSSEQFEDTQGTEEKEAHTFIANPFFKDQELRLEEGELLTSGGRWKSFSAERISEQFDIEERNRSQSESSMTSATTDSPQNQQKELNQHGLIDEETNLDIKNLPPIRDQHLQSETDSQYQESIDDQLELSEPSDDSTNAKKDLSGWDAIAEADSDEENLFDQKPKNEQLQGVETWKASKGLLNVQASRMQDMPNESFWNND